MIKHIKRVGNGNAIFLDKALLDLMGIEVGPCHRASGIHRHHAHESSRGTRRNFCCSLGSGGFQPSGSIAPFG